MTDEPTTPLTLNSLDREFIFLMFAFNECGRAKRALDEVSRLAKIREIDEERAIERLEWISIFDNIRIALHFAGSVSRIFFPPGNSVVAKQRGERLRKLTGMADNHAIRNRALRNHVEHMDERMDDWTSVSPRPFGGAVEMTIEPDMFKITRDAVEASCPFIYYRATEEVRAFGASFDLPALKIALEDTSDLLRRGLNKYRRSNGPPKWLKLLNRPRPHSRRHSAPAP